MTKKKHPPTSAENPADDKKLAQHVEVADEVERRAALADKELGFTDEFSKDFSVQTIQLNVHLLKKCVETIGAHLHRLKNHLPHGEFTAALEEIGMQPRTAQNWMGRFLVIKHRPKIGKLASSSVLDVLRTTLSEEKLDELEAGKTVAEISLDNIDKLTGAEAKIRLRKNDEVLAARDRLLEDKNRKIDELCEERDRRDRAPATERLEGLHKDMIQEAMHCRSYMRTLVDRMLKLQEDPDLPREMDLDCAAQLDSIYELLETARHALNLPTFEALSFVLQARSNGDLTDVEARAMEQSP